MLLFSNGILVGRGYVVRCYIETLSEDKRGNATAEQVRYANRSYSILLDADSVPQGFNPTVVALEHDRKGTLGQFTVQRIEWFDLVKTVQIWV